MNALRLAAGVAFALVAATAAAGGPATAPLTADEAAAFADLLEAQVEARLRLLPDADAPLAEAAAACATRVHDVRVAAFRQDHPQLIELPGGRLLVSTGMLASVERDSELVSLLAHGAGHAARQDMLDRLTKAYGAQRLRRIAGGEDRDVLAGMAANIAAGGIMTRHGSSAERGAEDAARVAGCEGGLSVVLSRSEGQARARKKDRQAHPGIPVEAAFPGAADPAVTMLGKLREALGPVP